MMVSAGERASDGETDYTCAYDGCLNSVLGRVEVGRREHGDGLAVSNQQ